MAKAQRLELKATGLYDVSFAELLLSNGNRAEMVQKLATAINVQFTESSMHLPFVQSMQFQNLLKEKKVFLFGPSGCGKSRTIIELLNNSDTKYDRIIVMNPSNPAGLNSCRENIIALSQQLGRNDLVIWDNFPDGLIKRDLENAFAALEVINSMPVQNLYIALKPAYLEMYRGLTVGFPDIFTHEIVCDLATMKKLIMAYGQVGQYKDIFQRFVSPNVDRIAQILWQKQPLPLTIVDYYKALLDMSQKSIDESAALQTAQSWLPVYNYFERQFEILKNIPGRKRDVEFLYILRLCYEVGFDRTHELITSLQKGIFGSAPPVDPTFELGTWLYLSGQNYAMHDSAKNAVSFTDYARMKIMSYIAENFLAIVPSGDGDLHSFGLFIGKNIQFIPNNNTKEKSPSSSPSIIPEQVYKFMKKNAVFERALGRGVGEDFEQLDDTLQEIILEFVDTEIEFGNGLADSLGERFIELDKSDQERVLEKSYRGMFFARYFGQSIGRLYNKMTPELRSLMMTHAEKNPQFADGLGMGFGYIYPTVDSSLQVEIMSIAKRSFEVSRGLGFGFGITFAYQQEGDALKMVSVATGNPELDTGFGMGMAVSYSNLSDELRKFLFERVATDCEFAFGVGVYSANFHRESIPPELFELVDDNTEVSNGLGVGYGAGFFYLSDKFQSKLDGLLRVNTKIDDGFGSGMGLILKHLPANFQDLFFTKTSSSNAFACGLGYGLGFTWQYIDDALRKRAVTAVNSNSYFACGLGYGLGCHLNYLNPAYFEHIISIADTNSELDRGLGIGAAWAWPYYSDNLRAFINERMGTRVEFARGLGFGLARVIMHFSSDERERLLRRLDCDLVLSEGFGEGVGNYLWSIYDEEKLRKFLGQAGASPEIARGIGSGIGNLHPYFRVEVDSGNSFRYLFNTKTITAADPYLRRGIGIGMGRAYKYLSKDTLMNAFHIAQIDLEFAAGFGQGIGTVYSYLEGAQKEHVLSYLGDNGFSRGLGIGLGAVFSYLQEEIRENILMHAGHNTQLSLGLGEGFAVHLSYTSETFASRILELSKNNPFIASGFGQGCAIAFRYLSQATRDHWLLPYAGIGGFAFGYGVGIGKIQRHHSIKNSSILKEEGSYFGSNSDKFGEGLAIGLGSIAWHLQKDVLDNILESEGDFVKDFGFGLGHIFSLLDRIKRQQIIEIAIKYNKREFLTGLAEGAGHYLPSGGSQPVEEIMQAMGSLAAAKGAARGIVESFGFLSLSQVLAMLEYTNYNSEYAKILGRGVAEKFASFDQEIQSTILDVLQNYNDFSREFIGEIPNHFAYTSSQFRKRITNLILKYPNAETIPKTDGLDGNEEEYIRFAQFPVVGLSTKASGEWNNNVVDREISFSGKVQKCCVCFIDMMDSTKISSDLTPSQLRRYYEIFLNAIAVIARNFEAKIVKNVGDALIFYFDNASDPNNTINFKNVLDCCLTMGMANSILNAKMLNDKLPPVRYRISADYGQVSVAKSLSSQSQDLFGPAMNICAKINSMAKPNGLVIGKNLFDIVNGLYGYLFIPSSEGSIGDREKYPVYHVKEKEEKDIMNPFERRAMS